MLSSAGARVPAAPASTPSGSSEIPGAITAVVSHQVRKLEDEIGTALFAGSGRRMEVTAAGEAFLPWAGTRLEAPARAAAGLAVALLPARFAPTSGARSLSVRGGPHRREFLAWNSFQPSPAASAALRLLP